MGVRKDGSGFGTRAQSSPIAVVLVFGLVIASTTVIIGLGAFAIQDSQRQLGSNTAENTMTQFSSEVSLVAENGGNSQVVPLQDGSGGSYSVNNTTGRLSITAVPSTGSSTELINTSLGAVIYENGDTRIAYQGGGVWRGSGNDSTMISPPNTFYRNGTLTIQTVNVSGDSTLDGEALISRNGSRNSDAQSFHGSLNDRYINVTVRSEYYRAWGSYFETRTDSDVFYDHTNDTVTARLVPPPTPVEINSGIVSSGDLTLDGASNIDGSVSLGGTTDDEGSITGDIDENVPENRELESASSIISGADSRLSGESAPADSGTIEAGSYYVSDDSIFDDQTTFDTNDGDIELYVDGDLNASSVGGPPSSPPEVEVIGDGDVEIYVAGEFHMDGQPTWGEDDTVDSLTVYSENVDRVTDFHGVLYTDAIDIEGGGGGGPGTTDLQGAVISTTDDVEMSGQIQVQYDSSLSDTVLQEVDTQYATITYLHISEVRVEVD